GSGRQQLDRRPLRADRRPGDLLPRPARPDPGALGRRGLDQRARAGNRPDHRRIPMTAARVLILAFVVALLAGCGGTATSRPAAYRGSLPPPGIHAPDFALRSYRGPVVRMATLRGKVVLVTFLDTKCTESCPI